MLAKGGGLSPRREASTSLQSRQCACIPWHWFGEGSGEWPRCREKNVSLRRVSPVFLCKSCRWRLVQKNLQSEPL